MKPESEKDQKECETPLNFRFQVSGFSLLFTGFKLSLHFKLISFCVAAELCSAVPLTERQLHGASHRSMV